jgi:hypothetical protein
MPGITRFVLIKRSTARTALAQLLAFLPDRFQSVVATLDASIAVPAVRSFGNAGSPDFSGRASVLLAVE